MSDRLDACISTSVNSVRNDNGERKERKREREKGLLRETMLAGGGHPSNMSEGFVVCSLSAPLLKERPSRTTPAYDDGTRHGDAMGALAGGRTPSFGCMT